MQSNFNRRKSRAIAMEILYSDTVNVRDEEITDEFLLEFADITDTTEHLDLAYIRRAVGLASDQDTYIRAVILPHLKDWTMDRISKVNLAILKIATTEILFMDDIPGRVSLNEALELSKTYSDEESTAFINGVLDKILKAKLSGTLLPLEEEDAQADILAAAERELDDAFDRAGTEDSPADPSAEESPESAPEGEPAQAVSPVTEDPALKTANPENPENPEANSFEEPDTSGSPDSDEVVNPEVQAFLEPDGLTQDLTPSLDEAAAREVEATSKASPAPGAKNEGVETLVEDPEDLH